MALGLKIRITFPDYIKHLHVVPCHIKTAGNRGKAFPFLTLIRGKHSKRGRPGEFSMEDGARTGLETQVRKQGGQRPAATSDQF